MFIVGTFGFWITIELETEGAENPNIPTIYYMFGNMLIPALSTTIF